MDIGPKRVPLWIISPAELIEGKVRAWRTSYCGYIVVIRPNMLFKDQRELGNSRVGLS